MKNQDIEGPTVVRGSPRFSIVRSAVPELPELTSQEAAFLSQSAMAVSKFSQQSAYPVLADYRQSDTAITRDIASLIYSAAYGISALFVSLGLMVIVYMFRGGSLGGYFFVGLLLWGVCLLTVLYYNRNQGLFHSPSGIAHHEIDARIVEAEIKADVAKHAIDAHIDLLKYKWSLTDGRTIHE